MKYRKIPVVIEAFQYGGDLDIPDWLKEDVNGRKYCFVKKELYIQTLEGSMHVDVGDYIIQGVNGEIYPCKPDIFEKTYVELGED